MPKINNIANKVQDDNFIREAIRHIFSNNTVKKGNIYIKLN